MLTVDPFPLPSDSSFNLVVAGVGGQGNVLVSELIGRMLMSRGFEVVVGETYGASQRGGSVMSHVRISKRKALGPLIPHGNAHLIVGLEPMETLRMLGPYGNPQVQVLTNTRAVAPISVLAGETEYPPLADMIDAIRSLSSRTWTIAATEIALSLGDAKMANLVMLGALHRLALLPFDRSDMETAVAQALPSSRMDLNRRAFEAGYEGVAEPSAVDIVPKDGP
jgi:indolepyruvate ferredoxin oxidoreductase, beta subunit